MAQGITHFFDASRFLGSSGGASGATVFFYYSGTSDLAPIFADKALTTPLLNPVSVAVGAIVPNIYLSTSISYRRRVVFTDGSVWDVDPIPVAGDSSDLSVTTKTELAGLPTSFNLAYLNGEPFVFLSGNQTAKVSSDPLKGLYVAPASDTTGASGCWSRVWDNIYGKPEWFYTSEWADAIEACIELCPVTQLGFGDYFTNRTVIFNKSYRTLRGATPGSGYGTSGTRLICTDGTKDVVRWGPSSQPAQPSDNTRRMVLENVALLNIGTRPTPTPGSEENSPKMLRMQWLIECEARNVQPWEPLIGVYSYGCVKTYLRNVKVFRSASLTGSNDFLRAFWVRGIPAYLAGGNASLFLEDCSLETVPPLSVTKIGVYLDGEAADTFIDGFEGSAATNGIVYAGSGSGNYGKIDIHFRNCVFDQCAGQAIKISGLTGAACVTINGGYYQSKSSASSVIEISGSGSGGRVSIGGGTQVACAEGTTTKGIYCNNQPNLTVDSTVTIIDCPTPFYVDGASHGGSFEGTITNYYVGSGSGYAISFNGTSTNWRVVPSVQGKSSAFAQTIFLIGTGQNKFYIDPTRVDVGTLAGGGPKVVINATGITTPGNYTNTGASGSSGAGIQVTGITS